MYQKANSPIYCADIIARHDKKKDSFIIIERLDSVPGLALPGGKQEPEERLSDSARREFMEETGMRLTLLDVLETRAESGRDPRGAFVSTVFLGIAHGSPKNEANKTHVLALTAGEIMQRQHEFVFDHFDVLRKFITQSNKT